MGILLFILSLILFIPLTGVNLTLVMVKHRSWKALDGYFYQTAIDIDRFGNRNFRTLFNKTLVQPYGYPFGDPRETISSVLGKNQRIGYLSRAGHALAWLLDSLDKNHCQKSIKEF